MSDKKRELTEEELEEVNGGNWLFDWLLNDNSNPELNSNKGYMKSGQTNNGNKFVCEKCKMAFNSKHELRQHINKIHSSIM